MKFNFRKIMSVAASAIMLGSTFGIAAAATYPEPFVSSGAANGAIVVGANAAASDWAAAIDLSQSLNNLVTTGGTTSASVTGEAAALFTSGTKLYINDSLNTVKSALTDNDLPTVLKDDSFSGNVDATYVQTITMGPNSQIVHDKIPTSSDDPSFGVAFSSTSGKWLYNSTVTFNKEVNLSHADSEGQDIKMFGQKFTIAASSDVDTLVLLKEAEKLTLDSTTNPSQEVIVAGKTYTVELVSASDTAANIRVTDSAGASDNKEINEAASKKVQGLTIAVQTADETNLKLSATIIAGAEKVTLEDAANVKIGEDDTIVDGTRVTFGTGSANTALTKLTISVNAPNSDKDSIKPETSFKDPVFGSFKLDFAGLNIPESSTTAREDIVIQNSGDDKISVKFADHQGGTATTVQFAKNLSKGLNLEKEDGKNITVREQAQVKRTEFVVVGNEDAGYLLKASTISQASGTSYTSDKVELADVFSGTTYKATITSKGNGEVNIGGKVYSIQYNGTSSDDSNFILIDYPDSASGELIMYPTIDTSKGAGLFFYEPLNITLDSCYEANGTAAVGTDCTKLKFPDGDGYTDVAIAIDGVASTAEGNFSVAGTNINATTIPVQQSIGRLKYNFTFGGANKTGIYLTRPDTGALIRDPAVVLFEEKDDNTDYQAIVVTIEPGATSDDGVGVDDAIRTWQSDGSGVAVDGVTDWDAEKALYTDSKKEKESDLWGAVVLVDKSDSDQNKATISYPDEQVYAQVYIAENAAEISAALTGGTTAAGGKTVVVKDSEASSVSANNLIVVGGSCINTVAATILSSETPLCGADFSAKTNVAAGQYLIKVVASPLNAEKIAMLVAGYDAADTTTAAAKVKEGVATDKDTETVYPIATA